MNSYTIRPAVLSDLAFALQCYDHSRQIMRNHGNLQQWVNGYPNEAQVRDDIAKNHLFIVEENGNPMGVFAFIIGPDPTYSQIWDGSWLNDTLLYGTVHRLACSPEGRGVAEACFNWCEHQIPSVRIDTHADNLIMRRLMQRNNYQYCGVIRIADGTPRLAYQKITGF